MKFRHLALKNVKGNWHRYIAFFLSCTFSVMIFYIFASFIFHPDVINGHIRGGETVRRGLIASEYIIIIFSFFFVLYSNSAFIKSRKKEFGLFTLFGMTGGQIKRLVFYENMLIAVFSIFSGLVLGTLFSKLFLMVMAQLLQVDSPIAFTIVSKAVIVTVIGFLALFVVITLFSLFGIGRSEIIELLRAARKPKSLPLFSKWLVALSIVTLGAGYAMAYLSPGMLIGVFMFPVLGLVIVGTYFLFTQGSVATFRGLQKNQSVYYKRTNLITMSQLIFKMKDNARVLFMVAILSAVVLTASGTFYIFFQGMKNQILDQHPQTIEFVEKGLDSHDVVDLEKLESILHEDNVEIDRKVKVVGVPVPIHLKHFTNGDTTTLLVSNRMYNEAAEKSDREKLTIEKNHAMFVYSGPAVVTFFEEGDTAETSVGGEQVTLTVDGEMNEGVVGTGGETMGMLVVNDKQYETWTASVPDADKLVAYGYELENWQSTQSTVDKIERTIQEDQQTYFSSRVAPYNDAKQFSSLTMFIGIFVSLLFFIASGSMIYFKLFTELQDDQVQFKSLRRIGMTDKEIRKVITSQIGMIFFIPFVVGTVHALFAFKMLQNLKVFGSVWQYGWTVIAIFFAMQLFYFLITRRTYMRQII